MKLLSNMNLKMKMMISFSIMSILIITLLSFFAIKNSKDSLTKEIAINYQTQAMNVMQKIDMSLFERYGDAQAFALSELALKKINGENVDASLQKFMNKLTEAYGFYDLMLLVDAKGNVLKTNLIKADGSPLIEAQSMIGKNMGSTNWFQKCISGDIKAGESYYSDIHFDNDVSFIYKNIEPIMNFAAPVFDNNNKVVGVWCNFTNTKRAINTILNSTSNYYKSKGISSYSVMIVDKNQRLINDTRKPEDDLNFNFKSNLISLVIALNGIDSFMVEKNTRTEIEQLNGFFKSKGFNAYKGDGWVCISRVSTEEAYAPVSHLTNLLITTGLLLLLFLIITTYFIAVLLTKEINKFNKLVKGLTNEVVNGKLHSRGQINEVGIDFKELVENTNQLIDAFVKPLNITAEYIDRISKGDIPNLIVDDYKGDFNEIKVNINNLINTNASIIESLQQIGNGDLSIKMELRSTNDSLIISINSLTFSLSELIRQINEGVETTAATSYQMSTNADSLATASQEQAAQADEVASAVEEMSRTVTENAMSAGRTAEVAQKNGTIAKDGGNVVDQTISKMKDIANVVMDSVSNISKLGESSKEIGEIVSVIDDIADQTNLLALNAAIEAARAGEQGRGFAVVADEVRKLAERTTSATKQIATMIKSIQLETEGAVVAMNKGAQEVQNGISLADKAGYALQEVVSSSQEVLDMINQIVVASEEQSATSEQISKNVMSISKVTSEATQRIEEIAHSSEDLTRLTETLKNIVGQFNIDNGNKHNNLIKNRNSISSNRTERQLNSGR